jgi:phosphoribosylformylglycinamidine synthase subunit PurS
MKLFEMDLDMGPDEAMEACEQMCRKLLANPVIQTYSIQIR